MSWILPPDGAVATINAVGDVAITSPAPNEVLQYDGANWINRTFTEAGILGDVVDDTTPQAGGALDMNGNYLQLATATTVQLEDITNAINTDAGKVQGAVVYNSTTDNPVYAVGSGDGDVWVDGAGTTVHTPV